MQGDAHARILVLSRLGSFARQARQYQFFRVCCCDVHINTVAVEKVPLVTKVIFGCLTKMQLKRRSDTIAKETEARALRFLSQGPADDTDKLIIIDDPIIDIIFGFDAIWDKIYETWAEKFKKTERVLMLTRFPLPSETLECNRVRMDDRG